MEQAHRGEWVVAGTGFENDPIRNFIEPVFPIQGGDFWVIQGGCRDTISGGFDAGYL
jgi:hypothetical protein